MIKGVSTLLAILQGRAVVITKTAEHEADVLIGKKVNRGFAIRSMVGAVKAMML